MVLDLSYGQCSQMVNIQTLTSIHADGHIVADEFIICRLCRSCYISRLQGLLNGPEMTSGHLDTTSDLPQMA